MRIQYVVQGFRRKYYSVDNHA